MFSKYIPWEKIQKPLLLWISIYIVGILFFALIENFSLVDSFYTVTITMATIGLGDIVPKTDAGKILTALLSISSILLIGYIGIKLLRK